MRVRLLTSGLASVLVLGLAGCGGGGDAIENVAAEPGAGGTEASEETAAADEGAAPAADAGSATATDAQSAAGGKVSVDDYVTAICGGFSELSSADAEADAALRKAVGKDRSAAALKAAVVASFSTLDTVVGRLVTRAEGAGHPDIDKGEDLAGKVVQTFQAMQREAVKAVDAAKALPADAKEITAGVQKISGDMNAAIDEAVQDSGVDDNAELNAAAERSSAC